MALPQTAVNYQMAPGLPGEVAYDVPVNAQVRRLNSSGQAQIIGYAYTESGQTYDGEGGSENNITAQVGGTGIFAGILIQPKSYSSAGGSGGPTSDTYQLPDNSIGELLRNGAVFVSLGNSANIGDWVEFNTTTGAIKSVAPNASVTSGYQFIPGARVDYFNLSAAGIAVIKITGAQS